MNNMIVYWLIAFSLFAHVINFNIENVSDLAIKYKNSTIGAYPSIKNQEILKGKDISRFHQLKWFSIGYPTLIQLPSKTMNAFEIDYDGFSLQIEVLTDTQKEMFKEDVKSKYGIDVETRQIKNLIPSELKCSTEVICSNGTRLNLYGKGFNLNRIPLVVKFYERIESQKIECFEHHMIEYNKLDVDCLIRIESRNVNTFSITWEQMTKLNLLNKLFGNGYGVYVTRHQMAELASEIHQLMNVYEEYWYNVREFSWSFINGLIRQKVIDFNPVPIDSVFKSLSKYSIKDLDPNIIKQNLSNVLKVKTIGSKKYIIANPEYSKSNSEDGIFSASASFNYVKEQSWANSSKSLDDQLQELNSYSQDDIEWELKGEKIVPKSLKVSRLLKTSFNGKLIFERIKRTIYFYIDKEFSLKYENDALFKRIANKSIETSNSSIILNSIYTRSLIECIEACEDNKICHYAQFSDKTCSLYKKQPTFSLKFNQEINKDFTKEEE